MEWGDQRCQKSMEIIKTLFLDTGKGLKKLCSLQKAIRSIERNQEDAIRIDNMAPVAAVKAGLTKSMLDLQMLLDYHTSVQADLPADVLRAGEAIVVGVLFLNGYAGRAKEWRTMTVSHVRCQLRTRIVHRMD